MKTEKRYNILGNLAEIQNILINIELYGKFHPLIKSVKRIENESNEDVAYRIEERPYQWIPINIYYSAQVISADEIIEYKITGIPFTKATIKYKLNQIAERETEVIFKLEIKSKLVGKTILRNKMVAAQDHLMKSINNEFANLRI